MGAIHDWATPENLQPEPISVEIWRDLPEEFCRQMEVVNGQAVRCEASRRTHQAATRRLATVLDPFASRCPGVNSARLFANTGSVVSLPVYDRPMTGSMNASCSAVSRQEKS